MSYADHDHREYADQRHDHDNEYAEKHHRHYDLEREDERLQGGLREAMAQVDLLRRELEDQLRDAFERIRALDRLRPTCVICLDATADRQTVRGPACTDCVGDLPDESAGADPDRPETWAFGREPAPDYASADEPQDDPDEPSNRELEPEPPGWYDVPDPEVTP